MKMSMKCLALAAALALGLALPAPAQAAGAQPPVYEDINEDLNAYYGEALNFVSQGLMTGTGDGLFHPDSLVTRAMLVQVLYRSSLGSGSQTEAAPAPFIDVPAGSWYQDAVDWAYANGVVKGAPGGKFHPNEPVTREDLAVLVYRHALARNPEIQADKSFAEALPDYQVISPYAQEAVAWAYDHVLLDVYGMNMGMYPKDPVNRLELAEILRRYLAPEEPVWSIDPEQVSKIGLYCPRGVRAEVTGREDISRLVSMLNRFIPTHVYSPAERPNLSLGERIIDIYSDDPALDGLKVYGSECFLTVEKDGVWTSYETNWAHALWSEDLNAIFEAYPHGPFHVYDIDPAQVESVTLTLPAQSSEEPAPSTELTAREDVERIAALLNGFEAAYTGYPDYVIAAPPTSIGHFGGEYVEGRLHSADPALDGLTWRFDQTNCLTASFHGLELLYYTTASAPYPWEEGEPGVWEQLREYFPEIPIE